MSAKTTIALLATSILIPLGSINCSHEKIAVTPLSPQADVSTEINKLDVSVQQGAEQGLNIYAPKNFMKSTEALKEARKMEQRDKPNEKILHKIAEGNAYLSRARELSRISLISLESVQSARQQAIQAGAVIVSPKKFQEADEDLIKVTRQVEKGKTDIVLKKRDQLEQDYRRLQLAALTQKHLEKADTLIQEAKKENGKKLAPRALDTAEQKYSNALRVIFENPDDQTIIQKLADEATYFAERALNLTRQSKLITERPPELTAALIDHQARELRRLGQTNEFTAEELQVTNERIAQLESEQDLSKDLREVNSLFSPSEASVIIQDDQLVIRLKGLDFKPGSATIPTKDFALLNKVGEALRNVGGVKVVIAGHTDSTGSKATNLKVSKDRAKAVKDYLTASQERTAPIQTVGRGSENPVASNTSAAGRAENRRVDVIIATR